MYEKEREKKERKKNTPYVWIYQNKQFIDISSKMN